MAADRFETPNQPTAGTNPADVPHHLSDVPYDKTSLEEAILDKNVHPGVDTGQLEKIQAQTYWSDRPPARESLTTGYEPKESLPAEEPTETTESHTGRNIGIGVAALALAGAATVGVIEATSTNTQPSTHEQTINNNGTQEGNKNTATPSPLASPSNIHGLETAPVATPTQRPEQAQGATNEFGITDAEYQKIVQSYAIDANQYKTPEQVTAAFMERLNKYYSDGDSLDMRAAHDAYAAPDGQHFGWGAWATNLYTKALVEGLYTPNALEKGGLAEQYAKDYSNVKSLWINSVKAGEEKYQLTNAFEITDSQMTATEITVNGTQTVSDNSAEIPSAASDSRKVGTETFPNSHITFALDTQNHQWHVVSEK